MVSKATCKPMLCIYCNKEIHAKGKSSNKEITAGTNTLEDWDLSKIFRPKFNKNKCHPN